MLLIQKNHKILCLIAGLACSFLILMLPEGNNFHHQIISVIAITVLMFIWWIGEALPLAITSLVPICVFPLFDIMSIDEVTKYYSNKIIYLMLSGFLLGIALQKWHLNYRIALNILRFVGNHPSGVLLGFMITTALLSMWVSNTATSIIMLPVALSFLSMTNNKGEGNFSRILILSIAYAASIGGMGYNYWNSY